MSFSSQKGEFDRFFNRFDRPVEESRSDRKPDRPVDPTGADRPDRKPDRPVGPTGADRPDRFPSLALIKISPEQPPLQNLLPAPQY